MKRSSFYFLFKNIENIIEQTDISYICIDKRAIYESDDTSLQRNIVLEVSYSSFDIKRLRLQEETESI